MTDRPQRVPWGKLYRELTRAFGWTPAQIGGLTLYQALVYLGVPIPGSGWKMSLDQFREYRARLNLERQLAQAE